MYRLREDYEDIHRRIMRETNIYLDRYPNVESLILGVSGGIDSCVTAALAEEICLERGIQLHGFTLPIYSEEKERRRAIEVIEAFCFGDNSSVIYFPEMLYQYIMDHDTRLAMPESMDHKIRRGNYKARLRMMVLYDIAQEYNGMVLSTDNRTEFNLGFWTLHGDIGDFGMIQNLWKTEVYGLASWLMNNYTERFERANVLEQCSKATPTDGLGISESDLEQLGADSYEQVDIILIDYLNGSQQYADHDVIKRHLATEFKRENPFNIGRDKLCPVTPDHF